MRKLILIILISAFFLSGAHALAGWVDGPVDCDSPDLKISNFTALQKGDPNTFAIRFGRYCATSATVSDKLKLVEMDSFPFTIQACTNNYQLATRYDAIPNIWCVGVGPAVTSCCPADHPYSVTNVGDYGYTDCFNDAQIKSYCGNGINNIGTPIRAVPTLTFMYTYDIIPGQVHQWLIGGSGLLGTGARPFDEPTTITYVCGGENCVTDTSNGGAILPNVQYPYYGQSQSQTTINDNSLGCVPNNTPDGNSKGCSLAQSGDTCVCYNGLSVSNSITTNLTQALAQIMAQCSNGAPAHVNECVGCLGKNSAEEATGGSGTSPYSWSDSIGCVDTRIDPFITRIIQIGLGIGSGIAIIRIIQGAFMRQTNDPAKIQEGNEIIISTVLALVVLAGALVLLQIIGVNVLGLFTITQFQSIIGN